MRSTSRGRGTGIWLINAPQYTSSAQPLQLQLDAISDVKRAEAKPANRPEAAVDMGESDAIVRKKRKLASRPAWNVSDLTIAASLAALLLPAWLLPESSWAPLCRAWMHASRPFKGRAIARTAKSVRVALGALSKAESKAIVRELKAAIYELRFEDLRGWRPADWWLSDRRAGGWNPRMVLEGEDHLTRALAGGNGAILWVAPFVFNSGPTKFVLHKKGYCVSHLSSPKHGFSETRFGVGYLNRVRCIPEDRCLTERIVFDRNVPWTAMRRMMRALKAGEIVSIVASSTEGSDMVQGPIFGGRLPVAVGAPRLAALTTAPLLPVFTVRDPRVGFRIVVEEPIVLDAERSSEERSVAATVEFLRRSEPWVRQFPEQWRAWSKWRQR